jgi:cytochrome c peroxidase
MMLFIKRLAIIVLVMVLNACNKPGPAPEQRPYRFRVPAHFPEPVFDTENPASQAGVQLGRMLFYDNRLSANNQVSCASCHDPLRAFSDGTKQSNAGVSAATLLRHSPALFNLAWANNGLFWDGGATNLESQAFAPLTAHDEMAQDLDQLIIELNAIPVYVSGFQQAFNEPASAQNVAKALAQFQRSLVSSGSKYDQYRLKINGETLTVDERKGRELVQQNARDVMRESYLRIKVFITTESMQIFQIRNMKALTREDTGSPMTLPILGNSKHHRSGM